jgi:hypothetical protein
MKSVVSIVVIVCAPVRLMLFMSNTMNCLKLKDLNIGGIISFCIYWSVSEMYSENRIYEALLKLGFTHIFEVEQPAPG